MKLKKLLNESLGTDNRSFNRFMIIRQRDMVDLDGELMGMYHEILNRRSELIEIPGYDKRMLQTYNAILSQIVKAKDKSKELYSEVGQVYTYVNSLKDGK